jgi:hypothetical protein
MTKNIDEAIKLNPIFENFKGYKIVPWDKVEKGFQEIATIQGPFQDEKFYIRDDSKEKVIYQILN